MGLQTAVSIKQVSLLVLEVGEVGVGVAYEQGAQICLESASVSQASDWICICMGCCSVPGTTAVCGHNLEDTAVCANLTACL